MSLVVEFVKISLIKICAKLWVFKKKSCYFSLSNYQNFEEITLKMKLTIHFFVVLLFAFGVSKFKQENYFFHNISFRKFPAMITHHFLTNK